MLTGGRFAVLPFTNPYDKKTKQKNFLFKTLFKHLKHGNDTSKHLRL